MRYCLMNMSRPVASEIVDELYRKALEMAKTKRRRLRLTGACQGVLRTEWKSSILGSLSGIEFTAEVVDNKGDLTVTFIVQSFELRELVWVGHSSIEEAEAFNDQLQAAAYKKRGRLN